jgi:hypothetical protein
MKDTNIIIRIDSERKALWRDRAEEEGVSLSQYIIDRVEENVYTVEEDGEKDVYTGEEVEEQESEEEWIGPQWK